MMKNGDPVIAGSTTTRNRDTRILAMPKTAIPAASPVIAPRKTGVSIGAAGRRTTNPTPSRRPGRRTGVIRRRHLGMPLAGV
jgi:hypothetical protein